MSLVDDVCIVFPDTVDAGAGLGGARLPGVWYSSRLLDEVELLEFLLRLAEVLLVPVDDTLSLPLAPVFRKESVETVCRDCLLYTSPSPRDS